MAGCVCMCAWEAGQRCVCTLNPSRRVSVLTRCCCSSFAWPFGWKIHLDIWMYRRHETYVWEDQNEVSVRKLPNDVLFPLRSCSFEGFDVPCPRLAEGWWQA